MPGARASAGARRTCGFAPRGTTVDSGKAASTLPSEVAGEENVTDIPRHLDVVNTALRHAKGLQGLVEQLTRMRDDLERERDRRLREHNMRGRERDGAAGE